MLNFLIVLLHIIITSNPELLSSEFVILYVYFIHYITIKYFYLSLSYILKPFS